MTIKFEVVTIKDLELIQHWRSEPHVIKTWGEEDWDQETISDLIDSEKSSSKKFLIYLDNHPIGFIQYYWASLVGHGWWEGYDDHTVGFDLYIGDSKYLGRGLGKLTIETFITLLKKDPRIKRIIADPSPKNNKMINLLLSIGFRDKGPIETPDGEAILMEFT